MWCGVVRCGVMWCVACMLLCCSTTPTDHPHSHHSSHRPYLQGTLYTEREWWTLAPQVTEEYSRTREPISLPRIQLRNLKPMDDENGVDALFDMLDRAQEHRMLTNDDDLKVSESVSQSVSQAVSESGGE